MVAWIHLGEGAFLGVFQSIKRQCNSEICNNGYIVTFALDAYKKFVPLAIYVMYRKKRNRIYLFVENKPVHIN